MIEGDWSGRVTGLRDQRVEIAMMRMPDGHGKIELSRFLTPPPVADHRNAPVNALGYLRVMFAVDDLDDTPPARRPGRADVDEVSSRRRVSALLRPGPEGMLIGLGRAKSLTTTRAQASFVNTAQPRVAVCIERSTPRRSSRAHERTRPPPHERNRLVTQNRAACRSKVSVKRTGAPVQETL